MEKIKSGFVSIVGRPNVGKSTFLNSVLKRKISIVTNKAQTTRNNIVGVLNSKNEYQIVFVDTPGIHDHKHELGKYMNKSALYATKGADVILFMAPANEFIGENDNFILRAIKEREADIFLIISKSDTVNNEKLLSKIDEWKKIYDGFKEIIPISSINNNNLDLLISKIVDKLPITGIEYYPNDVFTNQPERFIVRETIREEILIQTEEEIPHSVAILIEQFHEKSSIIKIMASIVVERDSQKGIIIGKQGSKIKSIGTAARLKLRSIFGKDFHLELFVKVEKKWRSSPSLIKKLGYDKDSY
ncbi:GTP-binding protein Era [Spiroplasma sabaudiense Ar-1343]|uniref:GTPase Era n=1 Tax=Spiroplasma sabaudiense Ar-1343 TaxID=1276257 RepID=W6A9T6_9MOLU|nr:GTPase Era [Spiroplasma sabaudiense]AHI53731.1 GTP-binding protein Era [Spiroplasma sabaudiense Ar-1343]